MRLQPKLLFLSAFTLILLVFFSGTMLLYWKKMEWGKAFSPVSAPIQTSSLSDSQHKVYQNGTPRSGIRTLVSWQGTEPHAYSNDITLMETVLVKPGLPTLDNKEVSQNDDKRYPVSGAVLLERSIPLPTNKRIQTLSNSEQKMKSLRTEQIDTPNGQDGGRSSYGRSFEVPVEKRPELRFMPSSQPSLKQPELVIYEDEAVIEFPKALATRQNMTLAIARVLLSPAPEKERYLLAKNSLQMANRPFFYNRVRDQKNRKIRYPKQAFRYAQFLLETSLETYGDEEGEFVAVRIPLKPYGLRGPAKNYQAWVENYAKQFSINPTLVYAVMETESAFNPKAISRSNAVGLMQVKAHTAGKDVYEYVDFKNGQPSLNELFDSEQNIRVGTAYLGLLKHDYLSRIDNEKIKELLTISSYNGGLSTVLGLFGKDREQAIQRLNRMSPNVVYRMLTREHPSDETRRYLDKVLKAESKYKDMLDEV